MQSAIEENMNMNTRTYVIDYHGVDLTVVHTPGDYGMRDWSALLPGAGSGGLFLSSAISDVECLWRSFGAPKVGHYCGANRVRITFDQLLELAQSHEHARLTRLFGLVPPEAG